ncbi:uncharacterized protein LOC133175577 [Saccostrea echinata]|uniref:uncharacterized protein LOC133175577 n=1 Tax=Saccostrea echinata TaxID=191078 RepID=UPI002A80B2A0|nr:uncharacterized protein LOC133175577 [Saccostrea echinata]
MESDDKRQSKVVRYSGSAEKQSIQFDDKGTPLYSSNGSTKYISENRNFDICVADWGAKAVVVVNQAGKYRFRYKGYNLVPRRLPLSPKGITTDSQGHILISDGNHECVHIINEDGKFLSYIKCQSLPFLLRGLCTDTEDNLFLLSCKVSGKQSTTKPNNTVISSQDYVKKIEYLQ